MTEVLKKGSLGGLEITSVADTMPTFNVMIYGDTTIGKTVLAGSASEVPALGNVVHLDCEGGTLSLRNRYPDVETVRVTAFSQFDKIYAELREGKSGYDTVIIDSLSEVQKMSMAGIMKKMVQEDEDRDPDLPGIGEWGKNTEQMRRFVRAFRDLPINVIFIALMADEQDKKGKQTIRPLLTKKLGADVVSFLDIVLFMYKKDMGEDNGGIHRFLLSQSTDVHIAKDRTDNLPPVIEDPTMQILFDYIMQPNE
jgi:hypothetical protein